MTKCEQVIAELAETPATAYELGLALGWVDEHGERRGMRLGSAWCSNLMQRGLAEHAGQVERDGRKSWLYRLTPKGRARLTRLLSVLDQPVTQL